MLLKHFPFSEMSFFGDDVCTSAKFDVSLFSLESISMSSVAVDKHERSELDFVTGSGVSTDIELTTSSFVVTSAIFAKSLLSSQSCEAKNS